MIVGAVTGATVHGVQALIVALVGCVWWLNKKKKNANRHYDDAETGKHP